MQLKESFHRRTSTQRTRTHLNKKTAKKLWAVLMAVSYEVTMTTSLSTCKNVNFKPSQFVTYLPVEEHFL